MLVSVIIPALNEAQNIERCIADARRQYAPEEVEIIVVDGGSTDATTDLVPGDVTLLTSPRGRAVQLNRGAAAADGEIFVFCHADSFLPVGWREAVVDVLRAPDVSGGTFQTLILPANWMLKIRNRWVFPPKWSIMFGDQVQFMRRETFEAVGGFPEIPLMEDVEMSRSLHEAGRLVRIDSDVRVITSARRFAERGYLRQSLLNGWNMFRYLNLGATPEQIARSYRSSREETASEAHA
jgi:rSAM/selenodomain-associated transferase 2